MFKDQRKGYLYLNDLEEYIERVIRYESPYQICVFGSLADSNYDWNSDIDLFILFDEPCSFWAMKDRLLAYSTLEECIFDIFPYYIGDFNKLSKNKDLFIHESMKNAIIIYDKSDTKSY
jgi:predicted nucleotidyltransferase